MHVPSVPSPKSGTGKKYSESQFHMHAALLFEAII